MYDFMFTVKKMWRVTGDIIIMWCARMLGEYKNTIWDGKASFHVYHWKGKVYFIQDLTELRDKVEIDD